jgi:hypothetical protein
MQLRGAQLKDLIYAFDDREREQRGRKAFVKLVYVLGSGEELHFTRTISSNGSSEYRIDNQSVGWDAYNNKMKSLGILVKARNFLVFQVRLSVCGVVCSRRKLPCPNFFPYCSGKGRISSMSCCGQIEYLVAGE